MRMNRDEGRPEHRQARRPKRRSGRHPERCRERGLAAALMLIGSLAWSGAATAELRVLLAFDGEGYRVARVLRDGPPDEASGKRAAREWKSSPGAAPVAPVYGQIELTWLGREGRVLATRAAADPRIAHPAGRGDGSRPDAARRVALTRGAWLVRGPNAAVTLRVRLPERPELGLPSSEWRFDLEAGAESARR